MRSRLFTMFGTAMTTAAARWTAQELRDAYRRDSAAKMQAQSDKQRMEADNTGEKMRYSPAYHNAMRSIFNPGKSQFAYTEACQTPKRFRK